MDILIRFIILVGLGLITIVGVIHIFKAMDEPVAKLTGHWRGPVQPFAEMDRQ